MSNPFDPGYFTESELVTHGFKSVGRNVRIARNCTIVGLHNIRIGNHVRIDGYCTIVATESGSLDLGSYIHIGAYCLLLASDGICMEDFSGLSHGTKVFTRTDDYSGKYMTNPMVPKAYTGTTRGRVSFGRHVVVGAGTVILPNVLIGEGASVGALSLVTKSLDPWGVYFGCPAKRLKDRSRHLLELEADFLKTLS